MKQISDAPKIALLLLALAPPAVAQKPTAAGLPLLSLTHGRVVVTLDQQGNITSIQSVTGTVQDVCQLLQ
jgi:hypothetical protein